MKRILLILGLVILGFSMNAQNVKGYKVWAIDTLQLDTAKFTSTTQIDENDTIIGTKQYIDNATGAGGYDSIPLNPNIPDPSGSTTQYVLWADSLTGSIAYHSKGVDFLNYINATVEFPFINTTGETIPIGTPMSSDILDFSAGRGMVTVEFTECDDLGLAQTYAGITNEETLPGEIGQILNFSLLGGYNTSGFNVRDILYVGCDSTITNIEPSPPLYKIIVGRVLTVGVSGVIAVTSSPFTGSDTDVNIQGILNGIITKKQAIRDTVIGGVIYFETFNEDYPTENLPYMAGQSSFLLNTTTNTGTNGYARVALTAGTSTAALTNYVYIDNTGTPTLTVSTTQFPADGIRVGELNVNDVTTHETYGFASIQRFNNAVNGTEANGWISKSGKRTRENGSKYERGSDATFEIITSGGLDSLKYSATPGEAWQFNEQTINSTSRLKYKWLNSPTGEQWIDDLNLIDVDSEGNTLRSNNDIYGLNLFYIINSSTYEGYMAVNTPRDAYSSDANAIGDVGNFAIKTVPGKYDKVAFRHGRVVVKYSTSGGGTFTNTIGVGEFQDERGQPLGSGGAGSGSGSAVSSFSDADFSVFDNVDASKFVQLEVSNVTTGTTRTLTVPNVNDTIAVKGTDNFFSSDQTIVGTAKADSLNITNGAIFGGSVGINQPTPLAALEVKGNIWAVDSTGGSVISILPSDTMNQIYSNYYSGGDRPLILGSFDNRADQFVLDTTGNVLINTRVDNLGDELQVNGTVLHDSAIVDSQSATLWNVKDVVTDSINGAVDLRRFSDYIYVVMSGQSNAVGWNEDGGGDLSVNNDVEVWNTDTEVWEAATYLNTHDPLQNTLTNSTNIGWKFCKNLNESTGRKIRYVLSGKGSTSITEWETAASTQYVALDTAIVNSGIPQIDYFLWIQGESDNAMSPATYESKLLGFFNIFDNEPYFKESTPILCGELLVRSGGNDGQNVTYDNLKQDPQNQIVIVSSAEYVGTGGDHFSGTEMDDYAKRFYHEALGRNNFNIKTLNTDNLVVQQSELLDIPVIIASYSTTDPTYTQYKVGAAAGWEVGMGGSGEDFSWIWSFGTFDGTNDRAILDSDGNLTITGSYGSGEQILTETAGAVAWDVSDGSEVGVTIDETSVITLTNIPLGWKGNIDITQGDAGDDNVTFVSSGYTVKWRNDDQDLTDASGAVDVVSLRVRGTVIYVTWGENYTAQ